MDIEQRLFIRANFEIERIMYRNEDNGFTVAKVTFTDYKGSNPPTVEHVVVGHFISIFEEDEFEGEGYWQYHDIYGYRFLLSWAKRIIPQTQKGIQEFLCRCVKGIGRKTAERIVNHFAEETISKIEENWENLLQIKGIGKKKAQRIHEKIIKNRRFEEIAMFVLNHGGGYRTALRIYEALGETAISRIRENPYLLCSIKKITFPIADKFAYQLHFSHNNQERIKQGILYFLDWCSKSRGDLYVPYQEILSSLSDFLLKHGAYQDDKKDYSISAKEIEIALMDLKNSDRIVIETNQAGEECVFLKKFHFIENRIVELLKHLIEEPKPPACTTAQIQEFIRNYEAQKGWKLAEKQKEAVHMALSQRISILTGGPGTGKTQTINAIIQCLLSVKPDAVIHLTAPTGKASKRITELTGMEAQTIHRKIGLNGFEDEHIVQEVDGDLLVVDESSMVDAFLFYKLLSSVTENIRILFVGDYEQLPSVGAGLILRDLINSGKIPTTKLTEIFRQAKDSQIVVNAHKVIQGKKTFDPDGITFDETKGDFYFIERKHPIKVQNTIISSIKRLMSWYGYSLEDIQVLSPMKKGDLGVWNLNRLIRETFNPSSEEKNEVKVTETFLLREGDKVIQTVNNYELEVFNGETGVVTSIYEDEDGEIQTEVTFGDGKVVVYDELAVEELELAFAISVHKSQGSEYPVIIMPIHPSQASMLNRNLIYTAWTRAKEKVILVGVEDALNKGIVRTDNTVRNSLIKEKIMMEIRDIVVI